MDQLLLPETFFKAWIPNLIASRGPDGTMRLEGIASSTVQDHHGDQFTEKALRKMAASAVGMTMFMNHEYIVPKDLFGTIERARVVKTNDLDPITGKPIYDLRVGIVVTKSNPIAVSCFEAIEAGTKLGISVGAMVPEKGATFEKAHGGRYLVDDCELVEASIVGLPANPRSFVDHVVKALAGEFATNGETGADNPKFLTKKRELLKALEDEPADTEKEAEGTGEEMVGTEVAEGETAEITGSDDPDASEAGEVDAASPDASVETTDEEAVLDAALNGDPLADQVLKGLSHEDLGLEKGKKVASHQHPHAHVHTGEHDHGYGDSKTTHDHDHAHVHSHDHGDDHEHQDEFNSFDHNHYHEGSYDEEHAHGDEVKKGFDPEIVKDLHPDLSKTKVSIWDGDKAIEIDTGRSKPKSDEDLSAQDSDPDKAGGASTSSGVTKSDDGAATVQTVLDPASESTSTLVKALRGQLAVAKEENITLRKDVDAALAAGEKIIEEAKAILIKVSSLPVGRKTNTGQFAEPELQKADDRIDALGAFYDAEVRDIINGRRRVR